MHSHLNVCVCVRQAWVCEGEVVQGQHGLAVPLLVLVFALLGIGVEHAVLEVLRVIWNHTWNPIWNLIGTMWPQLVLFNLIHPSSSPKVSSATRCLCLFILTSNGMHESH